MEFQANNKSNLNTAENVINFASNMFTSGYSNSEPIISSITEVLGDDAENILNIDLEFGVEMIKFFYFFWIFLI